VGERRAIVEDIPGVTRDRNYALVERYAFPFSLVDTGGFEQTINGVIETQIREQAQLAIEEADALMIIFDGKAGLQPADEEVAALVRKYQKAAIFCVNKCDGIEQKERTYDFFSIGIERLYDISALHKRNLGSLMDAVLELLPDYEELKEHHAQVRATQANAAVSADEVDETEVDFVQDEEPWEPIELSIEEKKEILKEQREPSFAPVFMPEDGRDADAYDRSNRLAEIVYLPEQASDVWEAEDGTLAVTGPETLELVRVAIIGKPNVGKSTLLNTLVGETRAITSPIAGTTRDSLDIQFEYDEQKYLLTDTAGLRKKARISDEIERYSTLRSLRAISDADVAVLLIDASEGPTDQDAKIAALAHDQGKGLVLVINKWDLVEKDHRTAHEFKQKVKEEFKFAPYAPIIYTSALSGRRCVKVLPEVRKIALSRMKRISTGKLNRMLSEKLRRVSPPSYRGVPLKLYYANQVDVAPPRFALFFNQPKGVHFSYLRFIKNSIREGFAFEGTDIKLMTRKQ